MTVLSMPPFTGPIRIDALAGHAPTWRPDHGDAPIYDTLVAEMGPPGLLAGPARQVLQGELVPSGATVRRGRRAATEGAPC